MRVASTIAAVALVVGAASGCRQGEVIDPPDMKVPVRVGEVTRDTIEALVKTTGTLKASKKAVLLAEAEGRFVMGRTASGKRLDEGDEVEAGQTIAELKNPQLVATTAIEARKEERRHAQKALDRALKQVAEGIISEGDVDPLRSRLTNARYAYEAAQAQLDKLVIRSPIAGRIVKLAETVDGDRVGPGTEIATVMSYATIVAEVNISNPDFPLIETGQEARIKNFALKQDTFQGTVAMITPVADQQTRAFKAEIRIDNPGEKLRPGMYVQVDIVVTRHENAVLISPELVLTRHMGEDQKQQNVVFVVEDEKAVARIVQVGIETRDATEILDGLDVGDALIVEGFETLRDDEPVPVSVVK